MLQFSFLPLFLLPFLPPPLQNIVSLSQLSLYFQHEGEALIYTLLSPEESLLTFVGTFFRRSLSNGSRPKSISIPKWPGTDAVRRFETRGALLIYLSFFFLFFFSLLFFFFYYFFMDFLYYYYFSYSLSSLSSSSPSFPFIFIIYIRVSLVHMHQRFIFFYFR